MTDVFLATSLRDAPRLQPLIQRLTALKLAVALPPLPGSSNPEQSAKDLSTARAVLVVWTKSSCMDENTLRVAARAHRLRNLIALRIEPCTPPVQFHRVAMLEAGPALTNPQHLLWVQVIRQIEALVGRPGLSSFDRTAALRNSDGLVAWAAAHRGDPLAEEALRLAASIREEAAARRAQEAAARTEDAARRAGRTRLTRFFDRHGLIVGLSAMGFAGCACAALLYLALWKAPSVAAENAASPNLLVAAVSNASSPEPRGKVRTTQLEQTIKPALAAVSAGEADQAAVVSDFRRAVAGTSTSGAAAANTFEDEPLLSAALTTSRYAERRAESAARIAARMAERADDGAVGYGILQAENGAVYRGQVAGGRPSGFGVRTYPQSKGGAEFQGLIDGAFGRTTWPDGTTFAGYHENGRPNGPGALQLPDGQQYEGGFNGARSGIGVMWSAAGGVVAAGRWQGDQPAQPPTP